MASRKSIERKEKAKCSIMITVIGTAIDIRRAERLLKPKTASRVTVTNEGNEMSND